MLAFAALDPALALHSRVLSLRGHEQLVRIGVHDFEKRGAQRMLFDVDLCVPLAHAPASADTLSSTVDYDPVRELIARLARHNHYELQETLCDEIVRQLLEDPRIAAVRVATRKPDVYPDSESVGVERIALRPATTGSAGRRPTHGNQTLTLTGLRFNANLGILDHEKTHPQPIQVDAELNLGPQALEPHDDDIKHVLDYRKVRQIIIDECQREHLNLLESMIGKLAHRLLLLPGVRGVRVKIVKLEIFEDCEVAIRAETGEW
jgi:dihydroneopterin aldolase